MFLKFFTFPNEFIRPPLLTLYHKRHHGLLIWEHNETRVLPTAAVVSCAVHDSFVTHHWHLIQMTKEYQTTPKECQTTAEETTLPRLDFPLRVHVNYVWDDASASAQILNYELWIHPGAFRQYMQEYGTFPFEVYFSQLLRQMLSKCHEVPPCRTGPKISDSECQFLWDVVPPLPHWNTKYPLFKHQVESFHWMHQLEQTIAANTAAITINSLSIPMLNTGYYYNRTCDLIARVKTDQALRLPVRGGLLADVTGSGKTAVALALVVANGHTTPHDSLMTPLEDQLYFRSRATLVVTPNHLSQQWLQEMNKFLLLKHFKVVFVTNLREFKRVTLAELLEADLVMTTDVFLTSKRYTDEVAHQARCLIKFPFVEHEAAASIANPLAWRIAVHGTGFEHEGCVPLESIKWSRLILDEIHTFFQPDRKPRVLPPLTACFHWGLSGTPMFQNPQVMHSYVRYVCSSPPHWVPEFLVAFMERCVHRFDGLELNAIERHLHLVDHTEREKQLLRCYDHIHPEKLIQLCSYFHLVDVDDLNQKIRLLSIDDIIKTVKKDKRSKIRDLESKIKYHDLAIRNVLEKIEESRREIKKFQETEETEEAEEAKDDLQVLDVTGGWEPAPPEHTLHSSFPLEHIPHASSLPPEPGDLPAIHEALAAHDPTPPPTVHDIRDVRDVIRSRKRRLERMAKRRSQLQEEKRKVERSMGFFEAKVDGVKQQPLDQCPICLSQAANVITQCGHLFCRTCLVKCLKKKYQCPLCKATIAPTDAHEIQVDGRAVEPNEDKVVRYGTKLTRIVELVRSIVAQHEKVVLFVQWTPLMHCIKEMFRECRIPLSVMTGNVMQQNAALKRFQGSAVHVLMGSVDNTGLDLVCANHLIFVHALYGEEYVVKALEDQAMARIHRNGQTRKVHVYWFISRGTIEEDIYLHTRGAN